MESLKNTLKRRKHRLQYRTYQLKLLLKMESNSDETYWKGGYKYNINCKIFRQLGLQNTQSALLGRPPITESVLDMILNNLVVRLQ